MISSLAVNASAASLDQLRSLAPLLQQNALLAERAVLTLLSAHKSTLKLAHIMLAVFNKLLARGFCRKPDEPEGEDGDEGDTQDNVEGTGMGEGTGKQDISKEIEDEEQLLGTRGAPSERVLHT